MKIRYLLLLVAALFAVETTFADRRDNPGLIRDRDDDNDGIRNRRDDTDNTMKQPRVDDADTIHEVILLRGDLTEFYGAADPESAAAVANQVRDHWDQMPDAMRKRIEQEHPGTDFRILNLRSEIPATPPPAKPAPAETPKDIAADPETAPLEVKVAEPTPAAAPAAPKPRAPTPFVPRYADDFDVFGNRPRPRAGAH